MVKEYLIITQRNFLFGYFVLLLESFVLFHFFESTCLYFLDVVIVYLDTIIPFLSEEEAVFFILIAELDFQLLFFKLILLSTINLIFLEVENFLDP